LIFFLKLVSYETVNEWEAVPLLASVAATTYVPAAMLGTVYEMTNPPVLLDVPVITWTPLKVTLIAEFAANPVPVTTSVIPGNPFIGFRVIKARTVNDLVPIVVPSVALNVYFPPGT